MPPAIPPWLEEICQRLIDNDETYRTVELIHPRIDDVFARVFAKAFRENTMVTTVILSCYAIVDDGAYAISSVLGSNETIQKLQLRDLRNHREITTFFRSLLHNTSIEELSLRHCDICPRGAEAISTFFQFHPCLQEIRITDCRFIGNSLEILCQGMKSNQSVQRVYLVSDEIDEIGATQIACMLRESCLREIYLGENDLGDEGVAIIANAVIGNTSLRLLDLRSNMITPNGALAIQGMIVASQYLLELNLSGNHLGNLGVHCLARGLQQQTCLLEKLDLDANGIDAAGARSIALMLRSNRRLRELKIAFNSINDEGAAAIAASLERNTTLQWLSLRRNGIGNPGASALADKFPHMNGLKELLLTKNNVDQIGISALLRGLRSNVKLEYLSVEEKVSEPFSREIMQILRLNRAGRRIFREDNKVLAVLWPRVYGRICTDPDVLFHFVSAKPDAVMFLQH